MTMKKIIMSEIAHNSTVVFEASTVLYEYMNYICAQYFIAHPKKYIEISESIKILMLILKKNITKNVLLLMNIYLILFTYINIVFLMNI